MTLSTEPTAVQPPTTPRRAMRTSRAAAVTARKFVGVRSAGGLAGFTAAGLALFASGVLLAYGLYESRFFSWQLVTDYSAAVAVGIAIAASVAITFVVTFSGGARAAGINSFGSRLVRGNRGAPCATRFAWNGRSLRGNCAGRGTCAGFVRGLFRGLFIGAVGSHCATRRDD